jgi:hypothetical protein
VQAHTFVQVNALTHIVVAALATAFVTVGKSKGCAIVPRGNYSVVFGDNRAIALLHAVASTRGELCQPHKVEVECGPN